MTKTFSEDFINGGKNKVQTINEIQLNIDLHNLKKILKKYSQNSVITEKVLSYSSIDFSFDEITRDSKSFFYFCETDGKFIINNFHEDNEGSIQINKNFFLELSKHSSTDFKIYFLDRDLWDLVFCVFNNGKLLYSCENVSDWEDPLFFDNVPYFVKLAKLQGMKKKSNLEGNKVWDSEEVYDIIYEFRDLLASNDNTYLKIAPDWYLNMKSIPH